MSMFHKLFKNKTGLGKNFYCFFPSFWIVSKENEINMNNFYMKI